MPKVGLLTGGGDSSAINAALEAATKTCEQLGYEVIGFENGWEGLVENHSLLIKSHRIANVRQTAGTFLGTSRFNPLREDKIPQILTNLEDFQGLIAIGGDDTLSVAAKLAQEGVNVVGIPQTIDNDVWGTERCLGFETAVTQIVEAIGELVATNLSHNQNMLVEVMGRDSGWLAVYAAVLAGAHAFLIPEEDVDLDALIARISSINDAGKPAMVIVAEGVDLPGRQLDEPVDCFNNVAFAGASNELATALCQRGLAEPRTVILSYLQRVGTPSISDKLLALRMGKRAAELVHQSEGGVMVALRGSELVPVPLAEIIGKRQRISQEEIAFAKNLLPL